MITEGGAAIQSQSKQRSALEFFCGCFGLINMLQWARQPNYMSVKFSGFSQTWTLSLQ